MVAVQVMGNDTAVSMAASQGNFELNVFLPVCAYNFLQSARLLAESMASFNERCVRGIRANREKMAENERKTTWFQRLHRMRPLPATASPGKSHVPS